MSTRTVTVPDPPEDGSSPVWDEGEGRYQNQVIGGGGEANTTSNVGGGSIEWANAKSGVNLPFKTANVNLPLGTVVTSTLVTLNLGGLSSFGSAGQSMRMNSGATGLEWYTPSSGASITGTDNEVVIKSGSNGVTAANVTAGSGFIATGSGTKPTVGYWRVPYNGGSAVPILSVKDSTNTDRNFLTYGPANFWTVGNTDQDLLMRGWTFDVVVQSTPAVRVDTTKFGLGVPLSGSSGDSVPFRWKQATISLNSLASHTLTAAQYECVHLTFTGTPSTSPVEVYGPNTGGAFFILNNALSASVSLFFKVSGGTGLVVAANNKALTIHGGATQYDRLTADVA